MEKEIIYFCRHFWIVFCGVAPFWAAGIVGGSVVSVFAKEKLNALFAHISRGRFSILAASAIGVVSPLCMYGTVPLAASFSEKGMDDGVLAAFMMSSVLLNPQLMIYTAALGAPALAARTAAAFLCGAAAGFLVRRFFRRGFFNFDGFARAENRDTDPNIAARLLKNIGRNIRATAPGFLGGVALTAALMRLVPSRAIAGAFGGKRLRHSRRGARGRAALLLRRRNDTAARRMDGPRHGPRPRRRLHALRPRDEADEHRRAEDGPRRAQLRALHSLLADIRRRGRIRRGLSHIVPFFPQSAPPPVNGGGASYVRRTGADYIS